MAQADLNQQNICAGLSTEWLLLNGRGSASARLNTLTPGSDAHGAAMRRHEIYQSAIADAHRGGADHPLTEGANAILKDAGLKKLGDSVTIYCNAHQGLDEVAKHLTKKDARYMLSLRFMNGQGHAIAATHNGGRTQLFDPNLGEFQAASSDTTSLLKGLAARYAAMDFDLGGINMHRVR